MKDGLLRISVALNLLMILFWLYQSAHEPVFIWQAEQAQAQPVWDVNDLTLPAPSDIQELLNRMEPSPRLKVDGRIGPATMEKWNRLYIEISARQ